MFVRDWAWPKRKAARTVLGTLCFVLVGVIVPSSWAFSPANGGADGETLYKENCARYHEGQVKRAPHRQVIQRLPADIVLHSLELGKMKFQGMTQTTAERRAVSEWITGKKLKPASATDETVAGFCPDAPGEFSIETGAPEWNGWGVNNFNSRFQNAAGAGVSADQVPNLKVKWTRTHFKYTIQTIIIF